MPTLLRQQACPMCGHPHNFCHATDTIAAGETFTYVCPETGGRSAIRADAGGEAVSIPPQGAVVLEAGQHARPAGRGAASEVAR